MKYYITLIVSLFAITCQSFAQKTVMQEPGITLESMRKINKGSQIDNVVSDRKNLSNEIFLNRISENLRNNEEINFLKAPSLPTIKNNAFDIDKKFIQIQQIIPSSTIIRIENRVIQENISNTFCGNDKDPKKCIASFEKSGESVGVWIKSIPPDCIKYEAAVSDVMLIIKNIGILWISKDKDVSNNIIEYFKNCSTNIIPTRMSKLTGLIINNKDETVQGDGIIIAGKLRPILGMAVQIQNNKIYTAKHVIYKQTGDNIYEQRNLTDLAYIPFGTLSPPIPLNKDINGDNSRKFDIDDIENDQIQLTLTESYNPGVKFATIKKNDALTLAAPANIMIPGFMIILAQAKSNINAGMYPTLNNWTNYVVRDNRASCKMIALNDKCMLHSCTTIGGVSGSPIFLDDEGDDNQAPVIIAVHHGEAISRRGNKCDVDSGKYLNTGAIPNFNLN